MNKLLSTLISAAVMALPLAIISAPASAQTAAPAAPTVSASRTDNAPRVTGRWAVRLT